MSIVPNVQLPLFQIRVSSSQESILTSCWAGRTLDSDLGGVMALAQSWTCSKTMTRPASGGSTTTIQAPRQSPVLQSANPRLQNSFCVQVTMPVLDVVVASTGMRSLHNVRIADQNFARDADINSKQPMRDL
jgi:hypothetical protein